ncbi:IS4/Tn5 family transposase DNA-binding protein [Vibrio sp. PNB22_4_1]
MIGYHQPNSINIKLSLIHNTTDWAQAMFGIAQNGDNRRTERLVDIASCFADNSGRSAAYACDGQGRLVEGTYRFMRNEKIDASAFRRAGFNVTAALAAPDNIKGVLLQGRAFKITGLKGRWEKTLGQWAGKGVIIVQVLTALWDVYRAGKAQDQQNAQERQAAVSLYQVVDEICSVVKRE